MSSLEALLLQLQRLATGLVYSSEGDHPFETVHVGRGDLPPLTTPEQLRTLLSLHTDAPVAVVTLERVLGRHTTFTDPADIQTQAVRPRYEALQAFLERELTAVTAIRAGRPPAVDIFLLGQTPGGEIVGYRTKAIET